MARRFADWAKVGLLVLFCLSLSISVLISDRQFTASHLEEKAIAPTQRYLGFVFGLSSFPVIFTGNEAAHMQDVAWILRLAAVLALISGIVLVKYVKLDEVSSITKWTLAFFVCFAVFATVTPFESLFRAFHVIFFPQGNWVFSPDSVLIQFYPKSFFAWYAACWLAYSAFTACVIGFFGRLLSR